MLANSNAQAWCGAYCLYSVQRENSEYYFLTKAIGGGGETSAREAEWSLPPVLGLSSWETNFKEALCYHGLEPFTYILVRVTTAVMKHHDQSNWEGRVYSAYTFTT